MQSIIETNHAQRLARGTDAVIVELPEIQLGIPKALLKLGTVLLLLFIFLAAIDGLSGGFKLLGKDLLGAFFAATANPFAGLVIGILATTLVQSSSVTTSMIVALVAAPDNPLPLVNAIPMVMGANIGTTVTNTIVSLAHMGRREEFRRAFSVATCHDFFNIMTVAILLPLELTTGALSKLAVAISGSLGFLGGAEYHSPLKGALKAAVAPVKSLGAWLFDAQVAQATFLIVISAAVIFVALFTLVKVLRSIMRTRLEKVISRALGQSGMVSMLIGVAATVAVQSSSITTSMLVPLAGAGLLTLERAFPITLGANVGTTVTAVLAALAVSGGNAIVGLQIALVHLLFNVIGILLIYPVAKIRALPLMASEWLAETATRSRRWAAIYVFGLFYAVPGLLVLIVELW